MEWLVPPNYLQQGYVNDQYRFAMPQDPSDVRDFQASARRFIPLTQEIAQLLNAIGNNANFARQLKRAAAGGQNTRVNQLIRSAGVRTPFRAQINPDRIAIIFFPPTGTKACFGITVSLCW
ncbi:hypothetical protein [Peribacillus deserti]|uniref:Uncharacterized protein n=1 Tax=Peribacillus deserti TaxID=673318 RepID=A0A2N5M6C3_9BACI|nr:hypothetical protein [Peribacillus deserti]PLT29914.1 hypothetical protein CUU66_10295 [Peribacillus deserti]